VSNTWINYHHLYYFKTIAEEGSVSKAAEKLRLGQPTLSAQLKSLEDALGVSLFDRKHRSLVLTEQGKVALDYSKSIFKMGAEMYEALNDRLKPSKISLCIAALDSIPKQVVLHLVKNALKHSSCQITLIEGKPDELLREVSTHKVDLMLTNFVPSGLGAKNLYHKTITKKPVYFYAAPKFKYLKNNFPSSMSGQPLILPSYDSKIRFDIDHWASLNGVEMNILVESQDIAVKKLLAVDEMGILPVSKYSVTRQVLAGELVEIGALKNVNEELFLVAADRKIKNPIALHLMENFKV
jgi:LysR family transcriptional activator of nhaA